VAVPYNGAEMSTSESDSTLKHGTRQGISSSCVSLFKHKIEWYFRVSKASSL
jgi:hypothetical protein